jgi:uncharacterized protein (UPF0332 family)
MIESGDLIKVAQDLVQRGKIGAPKQAELRRAVSTAYYALFHFLSRAAANVLIGSTKSASPAYTIVYRAFEHRRMSAACRAASKPKLDPKTSIALACDAFDPNLRAAAQAFVELQDRRHRADYDPNYRITRTEAQNTIALAERSIARLGLVRPEEFALFLTFLLLSPRA